MAELVREILIDASPETIFELLTDAEQHKRWQGTEVTLDPRPGGTYRVLVAGGYLASGEFLEVVPNERLVFSFGWDMEGNLIPPGSSTVEYTLQSEGGKTRLRMCHRGLPDEAVEQHQHGWDHYLARLTVVAGGGDVGPDHGPQGDDT